MIAQTSWQIIKVNPPSMTPLVIKLTSFLKYQKFPGKVTKAETSEKWWPLLFLFLLLDNKVHGKTFVNLKRPDLSELLSDFNDKKELWDCHEEMVRSACGKNGYSQAV